MSALPLDRKYLIERHHLSHQQIDRWLGENRSKEFLPEKMKLMGAVKLFLDFTDILRVNDLPFICLKGPLLSYRIYGDPAVRFSYDIDLLIDLKDLESILKLMFENGYQFGEGLLWPESKVRQELIVSSSHHLSLYNKKLGFHVELHWTLMINLPITEQKLKKLMFENQIKIIFSGREFSVFTKEFELQYLMIHGAKHRWERLKWLIDINDYPIKDLNFQKFNDLTKQLKTDRIINQTNALLQNYFNKTLPFVSNKRVSAFFINYALDAINGDLQERFSMKSILGILRYKFLIFPTISYKLKTIKALLFSQNDVLNHTRKTKTGYFFIRPVNYLKRIRSHVN